MRNGFLGAIAALMAGAGLVWGQDPVGPTAPATGAPPVMGGVTPYPAPLNPEGLATNDVHAHNFWFSAEYLGFRAKRAEFLYPLVTTSQSGQGGVVGASTTSILYQGPGAYEFQSGGRLTGGIFFAGDNRFGFEWSGFVLGNDKEKFTILSEGSGAPLIARPYIDQATGTATSAVIASTAVGPGRLTVDYSSQTWGADAHWLCNLYRSSPNWPWGFNLNVFAGVSFFSLRDSTRIVSSTDYFQNVIVPFNGQNFNAGQTLSVSRRLLFGTGANSIFLETTTDTDSILSTGIVDRFRTSNQFYGGEVGFSEQLRVGRWSLGLTGKLGLGVMHTSVENEGYSTLTQIGNQTITTQRLDATNTVLSTTTTQTQQTVQQTTTGGLYANNGRIGRATHNTFAYMPEGILTLNYQFTRTVTGSVGYNFLYVNRVVRVPNIVSATVDSSQVPTSATYGAAAVPTVPVNLFPYSSYWIQGLNAGLSIQY